MTATSNASRGSAMRAENARLREENTRFAVQYHSKASSLLSEAQQVADQLVEEAVVRARDLMMSARNLPRDLVRRDDPGADPLTGELPPPRLETLPASAWLTAARPVLRGDDSGPSIYEQLARLRRQHLD